MRATIIFMLAITTAASASEQANFWGTWEPRPMFRQFWRPVTENWWACNKRDECGPDVLLRKRCEEFARSHSPETAIPELIADLCVYASEANELVYLSIMAHWPRRTVIGTLDSLRRSPNRCVRAIAEGTLEDFREIHQ